jgi:hypothetical protein
MSDANRRVLEMVEQKKITAAEGDALLAAMRAKSRLTLKVLVDPFDRMSTGAMLSVGGAAAVLCAVAAVALGIRYDGFLDLHGPAASVSPPLAIAEQIAAWPLSAIVAWLVALAFSRGGRFVDFLAAWGLVRILYLLLGVAVVLLSPSPEVLAGMARRAISAPASVLGDLASMIPMLIVSLAMIGWSIAMLVFGFRHASGLRGGRLAGAFIGALLAAEIVSKAALWAVSKACGA